MCDSLKASPAGLARMDELRQQRRWNRQSEIWCREAYVSVSTLKRFWEPKAIARENFIGICQAVGADWREIAETVVYSQLVKSWDGAPETSLFCDRTEEITTLTQWIVSDRTRVVTILGMAGIGKTALCVNLGKSVETRFDYSLWRTIRQPATSLGEMLIDILNYFPSNTNHNPSENIDSLISVLLRKLAENRVLLILDSWENILGGNRAGVCRPEHAKYGELLRRIGTEHHQSCLIITSPEKPEEINLFEDKFVRSLQLQGLGKAAIKILEAKQLKYNNTAAKELIKIYGGNPLGLRLIASHIQEVFNGSVTDFIIYTQTLYIPPKLEDVIQQRFENLTPLEAEILQFLAIENKPITYIKLASQIYTQISSQDILQKVLSSLLQRTLIEKSSQNELCFALQPVVRKCIKRFYGLS